MMQTSYETITKLTDVSRKRYGDFSFAAGYFSSMVSGMIDEMRVRGSQEMKEMADHYDRLLRTSIKNIQEGK
jgi:hypothetical protein